MGTAGSAGRRQLMTSTGRSTATKAISLPGSLTIGRMHSPRKVSVRAAAAAGTPSFQIVAPAALVGTCHRPALNRGPTQSAHARCAGAEPGRVQPDGSQDGIPAGSCR